ncbi:MAG: aldehyde dehydrogenase family protein [Candidatus Heimdallarchaeota archaeon]|nr:aldehyde dehydrogenase family protein [Candidatus Heimdallarchaeota archaeon]
METVAEKIQEKNVNEEQNGPRDFTAKLDNLLEEQRMYYKSGETKSYEFRKAQLEKLKSLILKNEKKINAAIKADLGRPEYIATFTTGGVITEIKYALERVLQFRPPFVARRLKHWMRPEKVRSPMFLIGSKSYIQSVPKGVVLIIGPWNYPFLLIMSPLIGAIAAGNTAVIKPSEFAPNTSNIIAELINNNFDSKFIHVLEGGVHVSKELVDRKEWDHLFFTGGTEIGRDIYQVSSQHLTPVTLELGGKSPTIVDKNVHVKNAAKRLVMGKFINVGQTCMAPDYLLVHKEVKEELIAEMKNYLTKFFGEDISNNDDYARIISDRQFQNLEPLISGNGKVVVGGETNADDKFISPTILDNIDYSSEIMKEEIFGPVLPIITWEDENEIIDYIESRPHPLALYIFTNDKRFKEKIFQNTQFGGGMVNDSVLYYLHPGIPFGGVGDSGIGSYGGKYTFNTFTHKRPIVEAGGIIDRSSESLRIKFFRYPPYNGLKVRLLKLFQRTFSRFRI